MQLKLEIRGDTIGDIMDGIKSAERRLKTEIVMLTGNNRGDQEYIRPFEVSDGNLSHPFVFKITNRKNK